jgi:hypothetical protein
MEDKSLDKILDHLDKVTEQTKSLLADFEEQKEA